MFEYRGVKCTLDIEIDGNLEKCLVLELEDSSRAQEYVGQLAEWFQSICQRLGGELPEEGKNFDFRAPPNPYRNPTGTRLNIVFIVQSPGGLEIVRCIEIPISPAEYERLGIEGRSHFPSASDFTAYFVEMFDELKTLFN